MKIIVGKTWNAKKEAHRRAFFAEVAKDERRTIKREIEEPIHGCACLLKQEPAVLPAHDDEREDNLQAEAPRDGFEANGAAIRRKQIGDPHHRKHAKDADEVMHGYLRDSKTGATALLERLPQ